MTKESSNRRLHGLQTQLRYEFHDESLLDLALTHKSHSKQNNERLEFLGDAVLGFVVARMLYHQQHWHEDEMSMIRARLVRGSSLANIARQFKLGDLLKVGSGERKSGGKNRDSILADAFEAIIGAILEDGGIDACSAVIEQVFAQQVAEIDLSRLKDAKTRLQEYLQAQGLGLPEYQVVTTSGADHARQYTVRCSVTELQMSAEAADSSRRRAEKAAAAEVLLLIAANQGGDSA